MPRVVDVVAQAEGPGAPATEVTGDTVNNHSVVNDGAVWLEVRNSGTTVARTVSARFENTIDGQTIPAKTWSIATESTRRIGPFPVRMYGNSLLVDVDNAELMLTAYKLASQA